MGGYDDTVPAALAALADTYPAPLTANQPAMFEPGDIVRHLKSMRLYIVLQAPPFAINESNGEPVYCYRAAAQQSVGTAPDPRWWFRPMHEMEDGRFGLHARRRMV